MNHGEMNNLLKDKLTKWTAVVVVELWKGSLRQAYLAPN